MITSPESVFSLTEAWALPDKDVFKGMKRKIIPFAFLIAASCGGGTSPEVEEVIYHDPEPQELCYRNSYDRIGTYLRTLDTRARWHMDPAIRISTNTPQDITDATHHVVNAINRNMDNLNLTIETGNEPGDGIILLRYVNLGLVLRNLRCNDFLG